MISSRKIRTLQLGSPTGLYGAERWILALVNNIDRVEIDPEVAVILDDPSLNADLCIQAQKLGIRATVFEAHGKFNWSAVRQVRTHILKHRIDILHTHGYKTDVLGLLATFRTDCKIITTPHGWSTNAGVKLKIYETLDRVAYLFFDAIVPLSEDLYDGLQSFSSLRSKVRLIPNGIDLSEIDEVSNIAHDICRWKNDGCFVIGYIGQLIPRKGVDILLKAVAELESTNWRLAIVGDGHAQAELSRLARDSGLGDRVSFYGFRRDRLSFLKGCDIFVLPSRLEGVPRCVMEAMACNVPIVASDIPGCRDLVKHGTTGLLFRPDCADELREMVMRLLSDGALRAQLASSARRTVEEEWSAATMAKRYLALYGELING